MHKLRKLASLLTIVSFILPHGLVFGQVIESPELDTSNISSSEQLVPQQSESPKTISSETSLEINNQTEQNNLEEGETSQTAPQPESNNPSQSRLLPGTLVPDVTGSGKIQTTVDTFSGALIQTVDIVIPKGRNEMQPSLQLVYNNQNVDTFSHVGYGWSLSLPYIERYNKTGIERLFQDNYFTSSLSGELASTTIQNQFQPKHEHGDFLTYQFTNNEWIVKDKNGLVYSFGLDPSSKQFGSSVASTTKWMLSEVRDTNNNFYKYEYVKIGNEIYSSKITYTGNGTQNGIYSIHFVLEDRPDTYVSYKMGYKTEITKRIKEITVQIEGVVRGSYQFVYTPGFNGRRSLLQKVTESKISDSGISTTMAPTTFEYTQDPVSYVARDPNANIVTRDGYYSSGKLPIDFDGNGLNERLASYTMDFNNGVITGNMAGQSLNTGSNQINSIQTIAPRPWTTGPNGFPEEISNIGVRVFDVNGDLLPDLVDSPDANVYGNTSGSWIISRGLFLNTGNNSFSTTTIINQIPSFKFNYYTGSATAYMSSALLANVNGDHIIDTYSDSTQCVLTALPGPAQHYCGLPGPYIGNGQGWNMNPQNLFSHQLIQGGDTPDAIVFADINNDGLDDQIRGDLNTTNVYLNLGNNTWATTTSSWSIPHPLQEISVWPKYDQGVRVLDINGDGLTDIIRSFNISYPDNIWNDSYSFTGRSMPLPRRGNARVVYINTGSTWQEVNSIPIFGIVDNIENIADHWRGNFLVNDSYFDANGDGLIDFGNNIRQGRKPDMLVKIIESTGGIVDVEYKPTPQHVKPRGTTGFYDQTNPKLPSIIYTVTKVTKNPGNGGVAQITEYQYEGGKNDFRGPNTLKFAGFKKVIETSGDRKTISYFHQGDDSDAALGEQNDEYAKIGKVFREDITNANGNLYKRNWYKWDTLNRDNGAWYSYITDSIEQTYDGNTTHKDIATTNVYDGSNGNLLTSTNWGEVQGGDTPTFTDIGNDKQATTIAYATNVSQNQFAPKEITKVNASGALIEKTKLYYDNASHGTLTKGNNTKTEQYKDVTTFVTTIKSYNSFGLVATEKDANENTTTYKYDQYNLLPSSIFNALNQEVVYTYDYGVGKPLSITNPDGAVYSYVYDGFGRVVEEWVPSKGGDVIQKTSFQYVDTPNNISVKKLAYLDDNNAVETYIYFDGFNRQIQTKNEGEYGNWVTTDIIYDAQGRTLKQSLPYFTQTYLKSAASTNANLFTVFSYDVMDRVVMQVNAVGVTKYEYDDWKKTATDALNRNKYFYNDPYRNLIKVTESTGLIDYNTLYEYNGQNKLTKITDANNNVRHFTYDLLGRRLSAEDIHTSSDGDFGIYAYNYDNAGNITQKTTPGAAIITYTYDALNRILTEDAPVKNQERTEYTYDVCEYGFGKLCEVEKATIQPSHACDISGCTNDLLPVSTKTIQYTGAGLVAKEVSVIADETYISQYTYDYQGNKLSVTNPDTSITTYTYNQAGLLDGIGYQKNGDIKTIVSNLDYAPTGLPTLQINGNGTQICNIYDQNKLYRLTSKKTVGVGGTCAGGTQATQGEVILTQVTSSQQETVDQKINRLVQEGKAVVNEKGETRLVVPEIISKAETGSLSIIGYKEDKNVLYEQSVYVKQNSDSEIETNLATSTDSGYPQAAVVYINYADGNIISSPDPWSLVRLNPTGRVEPLSNTYVFSSMGMHRQAAHISRVFMNFDTSSIPDDALLQTAYLDVYGYRSSYNVTISDFDYIGVLKSYQNSSTTIVSNDYARCGNATTSPVVGAYKRLSDITAPQYYKFFLNQDARPWIDLTGNTSLCLREGHDIDNRAPLENTWEYAQRGMLIYPPNAHPTQRSKIIIEYTLPVATTTTNNLETTLLTSLVQPLSSPNIHTHGYVYDAVGNITSITNTIATSSPQTTTYGYDNLDRLLSATNASSTEFFTYDGTGNILTKNGVPYLYETQGKTNPHAVTRVGSVQLTYDANGNTLTIGEQTNPTTNTWNYKNELTQTVRGSAVVDYLYDENSTRIYKKVDTLATFYPSPYFTQTSTGTSTTLVMAGNDNIATIESGDLLWNHTDHLGSTVATTNQTGGITEITDYSAFGHQKSRSTYQNTQQTEKYTGHTYDPETDLLYAQARYYRGSLGRFLSQDPVYWDLGTNDKRTQLVLQDPQLQNTYSYGRNNPLKYVDQDGELPVLAPLFIFAPEIVTGLGFAAATNATIQGASILGTILGTYSSNAPQTYKDQVYSQVLEGLGASLTGAQAVGGFGIGLSKVKPSSEGGIVNIIAPNGKLIGTPGSTRFIRELPADQFDSVMKSVTQGGKAEVRNGVKMFTFSNGDSVTVRNKSQMTKSPGVQMGIDIKSNNLNSSIGGNSSKIIKLKFK